MTFARLPSRAVTAFLALLLSTSAAQAEPTLYYHGQLFDKDNNPIADPNATYTVDIASPDGSCVLYEETRKPLPGSVLPDGSFTLALGDASGTVAYGNFAGAFNNNPLIQVSCQTSGSYQPLPYATRILRLSVSTSSGGSDTFPDETIAQTAFALEAETLAGLGPSRFLQLDSTAATSANNTPLTSTQLGNLVPLVSGTSALYVKSSGSTAGAAIPPMSGNPSTPVAGSMWFDTSLNQLKYYDGTQVMTIGAGGGVAGTVTGITVGTGLVNGSGATGTTITNTGTIALPNTGTAGTYTKVTTDAQGRVSSGTTLAEADIPTLTTAGHVSGGAINSGTIGGTTAISTSGNLQTSGDITGKRIGLQDSGTNYAVLKAPTTVPTTYSLVLPAGLPGSNGMVLSSDTSGNLSWVSAGAGLVTAVTGTAPITIGGTASAPVVGIAQATTATDGYLSGNDWNTFNNKLGTGLLSGKIWVGNGSNVATAVTPSGDVTVASSGGFTVTRIQNVAVSATAPTTAGQVLRYDGTSSYVAAQLSTSDIPGLSTALTNKIDASQMPTNCGAGQTLTFSSPTGAWSCSNIAITGSAFGSQGPNTVLAAPNGFAGNPTFRTLVAADIPTLNQSTTGTAANVTGIVAVANGGTGTTTGSITGTGALTFAAGGSNLNVTLTPSGSGSTVLNGNVGIGTTTPNTAMDINGALSMRGMTAPALSPAGQGRIYFDSTSNQFSVSQNGGVYATLATNGGNQTFTGDITISGAGTGLTVSNNETVGGTLGVTGAATFSGGATIAANQNLTMSSGTGTFSQTYTGTTTSAQTITANSVTTAAAESITANGLTAGSILSLTSNSTAAAAGNTGLNIAVSGANATSGITRFGLQSAVTATGLASTNVAAYLSASGAINNYGLLVASGNVGIGTTIPSAKLEVSSGTPNVSGLKFTNFTSSAPTTAGQPVGVDASGNLVTVAVSGSGTVNSGVTSQMAFYNATGTAVSGNANATISSGTLTLGVAGTTLGSLGLSGNTSGVVSINPQAAAGTYNFNLPTAAGTSGQVLTSGGGAAAPMTWTTLATSATTDTTNAANISSGTLNAARLPTVPVTSGGTGLTSLATNSLLYGNGIGSMNALVPVNSAVLTTTSGGVPQWSTIASDTFTQYALLAGRAGGQPLRGGTAASENLTLDSTANTTKGYILLAPSGGNVGIGTTSPAATLDVLGGMQAANSAAGGTGVHGVANNGTAIGVWGDSSSLTGYAGYFNNTGGGIGLFAGTVGGTTAAAFMGGNVGIGTTSPAATLDVKGHIANSDTTIANTAVSCDGSPAPSPSISGNDTRGIVTIGIGGSTTGVTTCSITFASSFSSLPVCVVSWVSAPSGTLNISGSASQTVLTVKFSSTTTSSLTKYAYICLQ